MTEQTQTQKKILVVENNKSLNKALSEKLKSEDFIVFSAFNGEEGLHLAYKKEPDLILLDLIMPVTDGHEFMDHLRRDQWGKDAKVIILSDLSMAEEKVVKMAITNKPICFLSKSSTKLHELKTYIDSVFEEDGE